MKRREFLQNCGYSAICVATAGLPLTACQTLQSKPLALSKSVDNELVVCLSDFLSQPFVLIHDPEEKYPVCLYKISTNNYVASLMKCSHQHCTTQLVGAEYICPCHGARFSVQGDVLKGPASENLQTFPTRIDVDKVVISMA